jgi:nucleoside-diphosphate-sugar epimerase
MKRILITGATGFVGKHMIEMIDCSAHHVVLLTRDPKKLNHVADRFEIVQGDLNDPESLKTACAGVDVLINLAAEVRNIEMLEKTNVQGTLNLIEAIHSSGIARVIHLSSVGVVGKGFSAQPYIVTESEIPTPQNEYERTKLKSERLLLDHAKDHYRITVLRPTNVFGEYHPFQALLHLMQRMQQTSKCPYVTGAMVNYVYVKDLCATILHFMEHTANEEVYQVGGAMLLSDFYSELATSLKSNTKTLRIPFWFQNLLSMAGIKKLRSLANKTIYDDSKLIKEIGKYPFGIKQGLERTVHYYRNQKLVR